MYKKDEEDGENRAFNFYSSKCVPLSAHERPASWFQLLRVCECENECFICVVVSGNLCRRIEGSHSLFLTDERIQRIKAISENVVQVARSSKVGSLHVCCAAHM